MYQPRSRIINPTRNNNTDPSSTKDCVQSWRRGWLQSNFKMADEQTSQESSASASETRISCFSKRSQDEANERVFSAINDVIGKNAIWSEEQRDRLRRRFREVIIILITRF